MEPLFLGCVTGLFINRFVFKFDWESSILGALAAFFFCTAFFFFMGWV